MLADSEKYEQRVIRITKYLLEGDLSLPAGAKGIVLFAHGNGSGRHSTRNQYVAQTLNSVGIGTLLVDLLTQEEKEIDFSTRHLRYDIELLASRIEAVTDWLAKEPDTQDLDIGYFGSSTGAAAALIVSSRFSGRVKAAVSRGGRLDLAEGQLQHTRAATLLIVGGSDTAVIAMNERAVKQLESAEARDLAIIPGAGHMFEEPGKMEQVAQIAVEWFECYLLRGGKKFRNSYGHKVTDLHSRLNFKNLFEVRFRDRAAAGEMLSTLLSKYRHESPIVVGVARGGAVVANVVANKLSADLDIIAPRRLRSPTNSEQSIGSIMQDGTIYLDGALLRSLHVSDEYLEAEKSRQKEEIVRRLTIYRGEIDEYRIKGRTVIVVDDGAATGATLLVAIEWLRRHNAKRVVVACPVASPRASEMLETADDIEILRTPSHFETVESYYQDFNEVSDEQVVRIVKNAY